ncbi:hypothetical protein AALA69_02665 [Eggerthellaceae bacterium 24-137]
MGFRYLQKSLDSAWAIVGIFATALVLSLAFGMLAAKPAYGEVLEDGTEVYTVTFGDTGITKKVKEGEPLGSLPQMAKTKKFGDNPVPATFAGWLEDEGADCKLVSQSDAKGYSEWFYTSSDEVYSDMKLTAVYTLPEYRVHFSWIWPNSRTTGTSAMVLAGSKLSDIDYFTRNEGNKKRHIFTGVWVNSSTGKKVSSSTRVTSELYLNTYLDSKYISEATIVVPAKTYTGKALKPKPKVKMGKKTLKLGRDYTVKYSSNVKTGAGKIKITGKGKYKGSKTVEFSIVPKKTSITKVTALKKGFKVTWKKQSQQANGYIVFYKYAGEKYWRLGKEIHGASKTSCTINKLKGGKKCFVRVMPVKWVKQKLSANSKEKGWFWYGNNWSKSKSVKTKK